VYTQRTSKGPEEKDELPLRARPVGPGSGPGQGRSRSLAIRL